MPRIRQAPSPVPQIGQLRYDLQWQESRALANQTPGFGAFYIVPGEVWETVVSISFSLTTSAVAGNRNPAIEVRTPDNIVAYTIPANQVQAPSVVQSYAFLANVAAPWQPTVSFSVTPFPSLLLASGWKLFLDTPGAAAGDTYTGFYLITTKIPTGPAVETLPPAAPAKV